MKLSRDNFESENINKNKAFSKDNCNIFLKDNHSKGSCFVFANNTKNISFESKKDLMQPQSNYLKNLNVNQEKT
jgi:hypothetical protein